MTERTPPRCGQRLTEDTPLSNRETLFVHEFLLDWDGPRAARVVGYSGKNVKCTASRLLAAPHVAAAVKREIADRTARLRATVDNTVREIARLCFSDVGELFDESGRLKNVKALPPDVRACIASIKVVKKNLITGDNSQEWVHEVKLWNK